MIRIDILSQNADQAVMRVAGEVWLDYEIELVAQEGNRYLQTSKLLVLDLEHLHALSDHALPQLKEWQAQGRMQVVPRFHLDKLPEEDASFLDPVTNVQVGARVLKESISRNGGLEDGLQQFGGAVNDAARRYSAKVLAEKQRLEQAAQRLRTAA